jgi:hypothetical protein
MFATRGHLPLKASPRGSSAAHAAARFLSTLLQTRKFAPSVLNSLRTLFRARSLQPPHIHAVAHSFAHRENLTLAFPITSALLARSLAPERKATPLLSMPCALFCKNMGGTPKSAKVTLEITESAARVRAPILGRAGATDDAAPFCGSGLGSFLAAGPETLPVRQATAPTAAAPGNANLRIGSVALPLNLHHLSAAFSSPPPAAPTLLATPALGSSILVSDSRSLP